MVVFFVDSLLETLVKIGDALDGVFVDLFTELFGSLTLVVRYDVYEALGHWVM